MRKSLIKSKSVFMVLLIVMMSLTLSTFATPLTALERQTGDDGVTDYAFIKPVTYQSTVPEINLSAFKTKNLDNEDYCNTAISLLSSINQDMDSLYNSFFKFIESLRRKAVTDIYLFIADALVELLSGKEFTYNNIKICPSAVAHRHLSVQLGLVLTVNTNN